MLSMKKRILTVLVVAGLFGALSVTTYALTTQEKINQKEQEKKETENRLNETQNNIEGMQEQQNTLKGELNNLNTQLTEVSDNLEKLENQIDAKEQEIEVTQQELAEAQKTADDQYAAMKKRIQYMYERNDYYFLEAMLSANNFSDMLNYFDYVNALSAYDRKMLTQFEQTRDDIAAYEVKLNEEREELADYKVQVEAEQARVSGLVSSTSNSIAQYSSQISVAEQEAEAYEAQIKQQEEDLKALRKKLAEEIAMSKLAAKSAKRDISQISFAEGDRYLLANLIYCEAGGEPYAGQLAVGAVVINRVLSSVYPDTVTGVIYQRSQFSPVGSGRLAIALAENKATANCYKAADEAMAGVSNVGNCVYFRTPIPGLTGISIGGHIFY
ncbi:MAG: cell wall hydrolase [Lachnospiraceae bacterium]|nr:cell wall hydrolase [Lachnospiraceae bacterium]